jgi:O-antigen/teichoic acid export membrane protein
LSITLTVEKFKSFRENKGFVKYFKNTSWLFMEKILRMIVGLFVGIWVARYLGPEQFGLFSYIQNFVGLFIVISTLGLDEIVIKEIVKDEKSRDRLIGTAFSLKLMGSFLVLIILAIAINFTSNSKYMNLLVFIVASATIFQSFDVIDFYFRSKVISKFTVYANIISLLLSSIIKISLILNDAPLIAFVWLVLFDSIILACGFIYFYLKNNFSIKLWKFDPILAKNLLENSWPLILSGMVIAIYMKIDQVMIKDMLGNIEVGNYAVAVKLSTIFYFIPMIINSSLFPAIINAKQRSETLYYQRLQKLYDLMVWIAIAIAFVMTFMSNWIVNLLYGEQYLNASGVLMIHVWAGVFVFLGVASAKWFIVENLQKYFFYRTLSGAILNITLNYILIPIYGIYGAAIATLISQMVASYGFNLFNSKLRKTFNMQSYAFWFPVRQLKNIISNRGV